jgi:hypothetical protein
MANEKVQEGTDIERLVIAVQSHDLVKAELEKATVALGLAEKQFQAKQEAYNKLDHEFAIAVERIRLLAKSIRS